MALITAGDLTINPSYIVSMTWDHRSYFNGPGDSTLILKMEDGQKHRIKHEAQFLGGVDAYEVERSVKAALKHL